MRKNSQVINRSQIESREDGLAASCVVPTLGKGGRTHLTFLDGIRGIAALIVVIHHIWLTIWCVFNGGAFPPSYVWRLSGWLLFAGRMSVAVFIILSGFCLMVPVAKTADGLTIEGGSNRFFVKRAIRIVPTYYCAIILSLLLIKFLISNHTGTIWDSSIPVGTRHIIAHILLLHDVIGPLQINYALWTIAVEWQIYFLFPILLALWRRIGLKLCAIIVIIVSVGTAVLLRHSKYQMITPQYVTLFFLGMVAANVTFRSGGIPTNIHSWLTLRRLIILTLAYAVCICCFGWTAYSQNGLIPTDLLTGVLAAAWILCFANAKDRQKQPIALRILGSRPIVALGTMAYSLYLIHAPLIQVIWQYMVRPLVVIPLGLDPAAAFVVLLLLGLPLILGIARLFFRYAEFPFHKLAQSYGRK